MLRQFDGRLNCDVAIQVAWVAGANAFDALAAQTKLLASLRAFRNVNGRFATERGHIDFAAEGRFAEADGDRAMQVIAIALKDFVFLEANFNVQVTRRAAIGARLAVARAADAHAVVDTRRNFDF